ADQYQVVGRAVHQRGDRGHTSQRPDRDVGVDVEAERGDLGGRQDELRGQVDAGLAAEVVAPAYRLTVGTHGAGVELAALDGGDVDQLDGGRHPARRVSDRDVDEAPDDHRGELLGRLIVVAELAEPVAAPAQHLAVGPHGAAVSGAGGEGHRVADPLDGDGVRAGLSGV